MKAALLNSAAARFRAPPQQKDTRPIVAICIPSQESWMAGMAMSLCGLISHAIGYTRPFIINELGSSISYQRNMLAEKAIAREAEYALFIDSDVYFPMNALERLLKHKKPIVGATYPRKRTPFTPLGRPADPDLKWSIGGLQPFTAIPAGFMLVKTEVFKKMQRPYFFESWEYSVEPPQVSEDYNFCMAARRADFETFCDLDLSFEMRHAAMNPIWMTQEAARQAEEAMDKLRAHAAAQEQKEPVDETA